MADTSATKARLEKWAQRVFFDAAQGMADKDSRDVPRKTGDLAQSRRFQVNETALTASVEYPTDLANWLEFGTKPHRIPASPVLAFYWGKVGRTIIVTSRGQGGFYALDPTERWSSKTWVDHPGSTIHVGWWSDTWNEDSFRLFLEFGAARVAF